MAKTYYFNDISISDTSQFTTEDARSLCDTMAEIVIDVFHEYGLHVKENENFSCRQGEWLSSDGKSVSYIYPDKCDAAWDPGTWGYSKDSLGKIFVAFQDDHKMIVSFGANRIAKENTNQEIISRIRDKAVSDGILSEKSAIFEMEDEPVEKPERNNRIEKCTKKSQGADMEKHMEKNKKMIRKYAKAELYGYGFIVEYSRYSCREYKYAESVTIQHRGSNEKGIQFDMGMKPITLKKENFSGNFQDVKQPLYLVEDDGVWKEYFSGTEVTYLPLYAQNRNLIGEYELWGGTYYVGDKFKGIREFVFGDKGHSQPSLMEAQDFANEIAQYRDDEIRNMVGQFLKLKENAEIWGTEFDQAVERFAKGHDTKNEMASSRLADGMGKYANVRPGFCDETVSNRNSAQSVYEDAKEKKRSGNGIIVVLVIALIIISFLWIVK
mgnify:CR=1 FL=1